MATIIISLSVAYSETGMQKNTWKLGILIKKSATLYMPDAI